MICHKCKTENPLGSAFCNHCGAKLNPEVIAKKRVTKTPFIYIAIGFLVILIGILSLFGSSDIKVPKKFNEATLASLDGTSQEVLDTFINELAEAYNTGNYKKTGHHLNISENLESSFSLIKSLAQSNSTLSKASNCGFIVFMADTMGTVSPGSQSTPKEVNQYIREIIINLIEIYYK